MQNPGQRPNPWEVDPDGEKTALDPDALKDFREMAAKEVEYQQDVFERLVREIEIEMERERVREKVRRIRIRHGGE